MLMMQTKESVGYGERSVRDSFYGNVFCAKSDNARSPIRSSIRSCCAKILQHISSVEHV